MLQLFGFISPICVSSCEKRPLPDPRGRQHYQDMQSKNHLCRYLHRRNNISTISSTSAFPTHAKGVSTDSSENGGYINNRDSNNTATAAAILAKASATTTMNSQLRLQQQSHHMPKLAHADQCPNDRSGDNGSINTGSVSLHRLHWQHYQHQR